MKISQESRKLLSIIILAVISTSLVLFGTHYIFSNREDKLIKINKEICELFAEKIALEIEINISQFNSLALISETSLSLAESKKIDLLLSELVNKYIKDAYGVEGGVYLRELDDFMGYAYPTSPPPIPVYGPPPRSYNIIRDQALQSVEKDSSLIWVHAFDPAIFPLATNPIRIEGFPVGSVWVRTHIERDLPLVKFKRVINIVTVISLIGFTVMAMFSFFLRNGIKNIKSELRNTSDNLEYRLKKRGGWFGFIPASINNMLDLIEKDNKKRKKLEKKLQQKEKLASLGTMVAGVAHEVKTPLAAIKTRVQMWQREVDNNAELGKNISPESLDMVISEIDRLSNLVKRLVIFSSPIIKNLIATNLTKLIEEVIGFFDLKSINKNIYIKIKSEKHLPSALIDVNSFKQVIINIITNSIESIEHSGNIQIQLKNDLKNKNIIIEIIDDGNGIQDDLLDKIFDPFFTLKEKGTGLGLTISHEIMSAHNGSIFFNNNKDKGVICTISLPIQ